MLIKHKGDNCFGYFEGEINVSYIDEFKENIYKIEKEPCENVVLNFNDVTYINSLGLGVIVELYKRLKKQGRTLKIVCNSPLVREIFNVVKFDKIIPIYDNDKEIR